MSAAVMKDPIEVIEMREELKKFGRVVRSARESHRGLPRPRIVVTENVEKLVEREDEATKKTASDR
jgi:hypothetical protein